MFRRCALRQGGSSAVNSGMPFVTSSRPVVKNSKPNVVVIGTGWGGARLLKGLDPNACNIHCVSMRNHMVVTPLLASTTTGTLEFRSITEPVTQIQPALTKAGHGFHRTMVHDVDFANKTIRCSSTGVIGAGEADAKTFDMSYDKLVFAHGASVATFGIPGVEQHAYFLREIQDARAIRSRLGQNILKAQLPTTTDEERRKLLHVVIVGGGPIGVEFAADLCSFLNEDLAKIDPSLKKFFKVTMLEAFVILGPFNPTLRAYGEKRLKDLGVDLRKAACAKVEEGKIHLGGDLKGETIDCGLICWGTGVGPSPLTKKLSVDKGIQGRIAINGGMNVMKLGNPMPDVFALGDCAVDKETPLPTLAAVAARQGTFLAKKLNSECKSQMGMASGRGTTADHFHFKNPGSMCNLGGTFFNGKAMAQLPSLNITGLTAFWMWRGAYFTMLGSWRNCFNVASDWISSWAFGRNLTYIQEWAEHREWEQVATKSAVEAEKQRLAADEARNKPQAAAEPVKAEAPKVEAAPKAAEAPKAEAKA